jgi:predicted RNA-binding protein with PUA domain
MGIWRVAGAFTVAQRQSECGSKTAKMHVSQPMDIEILWLFQIILVKKLVTLLFLF